MKKLLLTAIAFAMCGFISARAQTPAAMQLTSPDFQQEAFIPAKDTCDGANTAPALNWKGAPAGTQSFALIVEDPDAPRGLVTHWVVTGIPATTSSLTGTLPSGVNQGRNTMGKNAYDGPCPPPGDVAHRYFFRLYALDTAPNFSSDSTEDANVQQAMKGHILAQGELMGRYKR